MFIKFLGSGTLFTPELVRSTGILSNQLRRITIIALKHFYCFNWDCSKKEASVIAPADSLFFFNNL